jgi:hypothetical protein
LTTRGVQRHHLGQRHAHLVAERPRWHLVNKVRDRRPGDRDAVVPENPAHMQAVAVGVPDQLAVAVVAEQPPYADPVETP